MADQKEMTQGSKFQVCGKVKRRWVAESGKYGTLDIEFPGRGQYEEIVNSRVFKDGPIAEIAKLVPGTIVTIYGTIGTEVIKDKKGEAVMIDGYKKYVDVLTIKRLDIDQASVAAAKRAAEALKAQDAGNAVGGDPSDDMPEGW